MNVRERGLDWFIRVMGCDCWTCKLTKERNIIHVKNQGVTKTDTDDTLWVPTKMVSGIFQVLETLDDTNNTNMSNVGIKCRCIGSTAALTSWWIWARSGWCALEWFTCSQLQKGYPWQRIVYKERFLTCFSHYTINYEAQIKKWSCGVLDPSLHTQGERYWILAWWFHLIFSHLMQPTSTSGWLHRRPCGRPPVCKQLQTVTLRQFGKGLQRSTAHLQCFYNTDNRGLDSTGSTPV